MSRIRSIIVLLLCALWLPATLHCEIGAAGLADLIFDHEEHPASVDTDHHGDACDVIESGGIKRASTTIAVAAPTDCPCLLCCLALACTCEGCAEPALSPTRHAAPPEIAASWHFVSRAAPPVRAPASLNV